MSVAGDKREEVLSPSTELRAVLRAKIQLQYSLLRLRDISCHHTLARLETSVIKVMSLNLQGIRRPFWKDGKLFLEHTNMRSVALHSDVCQRLKSPSQFAGLVLNNRSFICMAL